MLVETNLKGQAQTTTIGQLLISVLAQELERPGWRPLTTLYRRLNKGLDFLLGTGVVALILGLIYQYVPIANNKRWTSIAVLGACVLALCWLITAIKRFHDLTFKELADECASNLITIADKQASAVKQLSEIQVEMTTEHQKTAERIESLKVLLGRSDALYLLVDNRRWPDSQGPPLMESEIKFHESDIWNTMQTRLGTSGVQQYFSWLGEITDSLNGQMHRMKSHQNALQELIQLERAHQAEIVKQRNEQKQDILNSLLSQSDLG